MALKLNSKITSGTAAACLFQNCRRLFSSNKFNLSTKFFRKFNVVQKEEVQEQHEQNPPTIRNNSNNIKQFDLLSDESYRKSLTHDTLITSKDVNKEENRNNETSPKYGQLSASKTYRCVPLPLKPMKLSNPFPDPVKFQTYYTISDEEKAETRRATTTSTILNNSGLNNMIGMNNKRFMSTTLIRNYSSKTVDANPNKCKKLKGTSNKKGCPKLKLAGCKQAKSVTCKTIYKDIKCTKQEAPYPSYSELCAEDLEEKPSECRMCPWKPEENPNFKPTKRHMHHTTNDGEMTKTSFDPNDMMECRRGDLKKPPCPRPPPGPCPPPKKKVKKEKKKPKKKCNESSSTSTTVLDQQLKSPLMNQQEEAVLLLMDEVACGSKKDKKKGPCKKFPFEKCEYPKNKKKPRPAVGCPPKKKRKLVKDCPGEDKPGCDQKADAAGISLKDDGGKKKKKCPDVDNTIFIEDRQPCPKKKRKETPCPGDLLNRNSKNRPPKKTG